MKRTDITDIWPEATKEQIDRLMDINGADIVRAKGEVDALKLQLTTAENEIQALKMTPPPSQDKELQEKLKSVTAELDGLKQANALRDLRAAVSKETGVPAELLTGETAEACKSQAEAIKAYAKPSGYPRVPDGGEVHEPGPSATRDKFAAWLDENFPSGASH